MADEMDKKNVALALSSGGARGLAHIGAIDALLKHGYNITSIAGTSMGSIVGGIYSNGQMQGFREFMTGLNKMDVLMLMDIAVSKKGIIKGEKVFGEISQFVGNGNIEELPIPFTAIAADLFNHREVIFRHGNLLTALRASSSVPTVLLPVHFEKSFLVDGGVVNPLPINRVKRHKNDLLVAINVNAPRKKTINRTTSQNKNPQEKKAYKKLLDFVNQKWAKTSSENETPKEMNHGFFDMVSGSFEMMQHKLTESVLMQQQPDILVNLPMNLADMLEFYKAAELIEIGYEATCKQIENYRNNMSASNGIVDEWYI